MVPVCRSSAMSRMEMNTDEIMTMMLETWKNSPTTSAERLSTPPSTKALNRRPSTASITAMMT